MRPDALARVEEQLREGARAAGITDFVVGIAVFREGRLLVIRRVPDDYLGGMYELPGGGVESGETLVECVVRELFEETGLRVHHIDRFLGAIDYATRSKPRVRKFSFLVVADSGEISLSPGEHDAFAWIDIDTLDSLPMTPDTREALRALFPPR
ncbi:MAG TPA: NUDIX domain-containing protein [Nocardia sp.]|uniref:NUDIX hydrolase n=1 Tax=Nocardia TaxID=1817 RepID=UPI002454B39B|nr:MULTISPECIES: NUDIX domain-containing protein [Nocardia]HLS77202.1 NUDIX domain-containing protein [Nocardia sp.]